MSRLQALFPDGPRSTRIVFDDHHTVRRLNEMFGGERAGLRQVVAVADVPALVRTVQASQRDAAPIVLPAQSAKSTRRGSRGPRRDVVNVTAGVIAAVVLASAGVAGVVHAANANPAADAYAALQAGEAAVEDLAQGVRNSHAQTAARIRDALDDVQSLQAAFVSLQPGLVDRAGDTVRLADSSMLTGAIADAAATTNALKAITLPTLPADDTVRVDERSLDSIAKAADQSQARTRAWQAMTAPLAAISDKVSSTIAAYDARRASVAAAFPTLAARMVDEYSSRDRTLRDAVTAAATRIATTNLAQGGAAAITAYRAAVQALVAAPRQPVAGTTNPETGAGTTNGQQTRGTSPTAAPTTPSDTGTPSLTVPSPPAG
ncbi:hypothetical protein [Microbacterium capsulatum]|uniref:Uncharacterized protein n=1 Tax=Microbacterium capsulatum TaxID=3041921 RepID=A0ABU0XGM4_9MICO|nr:hypothetical protein [Microbacterium sp. ASV81]MDQ4214287.1 hypothetical protein [Microbacterium sp. ASV81]